LKTVRIGIIGFGRMGITHFSILKSRSDVNITAVAEPSAILMSWFKKYLQDVRIFRDYKDLLSSGLVDAILVCTPPRYHYPVIKMAGERGIHVFSEKPFTLNYDHGSYLADEFEKKALFNQVGYVNRFNDIFFRTRELLQLKIIGKVIRFRSEINSYTVMGNTSNSGWRDSTVGGGGVIFEMASHAIDLTNYFFGKPVRISGSFFSKVYSKNVPDIFSTEVIYEQDISGQIYANWSDKAYRKPLNNIIAEGTSGEIHADQYSIRLYLNEAHENLNFKQGWNNLYVTDVFRPVAFYVRGNEFTRQLYDFIDLVKGVRTNCLCTFRDAADTLKVIDEALKNCKQPG
jgi:scyllo-inositol 2-dehydrogenase (NADP+)